MIADSVADLLKKLNQKVVFAESCTAGQVSATLASIPGISSYLCGSAVTYRPETKRKWLGIKKKTIINFTTESSQCVSEMALGVLRKTVEADWSLAIVGHFGPNAPSDKDGVIHICIAKRTCKGNLKKKLVKDFKLTGKGRHSRQVEATEIALTRLFNVISNSVKQKSAKEN